MTASTSETIRPPSGYTTLRDSTQLMATELDPNLHAHRFLYVPWTQGVDSFSVGEALGQHLATHFGRRPTVVAATRASVSARRYLSKQNIVTERSGFVPEDTVVIVWCPTRKVMQKVVSDKNIVLLVEAPSTSFDAWARLVGAYNVFTQGVMDAGLNENAREALKGIVWEGYNGWHDEIAETLTLVHLRALDDAGLYGRALVVQYAEMEDRFLSIGRLEKLLDWFEKSRTPAAR
ncbi:MAG: hypothetical protein WAK00_11910 [Microbacterium sp.]|uniref:hypothetical protein n=1 Tax=Microbacterium sp. TaxID=51671 RepID=UPI003BB1B171